MGISYEEVDKREGTPGKKHHVAKNGGDQLDKVCDELVGIFNPNGKTNLRDIRQVKRIISTYLKQALEQLGGMQVGYLLSSSFRSLFCKRPSRQSKRRAATAKHFTEAHVLANIRILISPEG